MVDKFTECENSGRRKLEQLFTEKEFRFSEDKYAVYDAVSSKNGVNQIFEVKERMFNSDKFNTSFIEESKFERLLAEGEKQKADVYYVCFFKDDVVLVWHLNKCVRDIHYHKCVISCGRTTAVVSNNVDKNMYGMYNFRALKFKMK